jgi:hypothetical protein
MSGGSAGLTQRHTPRGAVEQRDRPMAPGKGAAAPGGGAGVLLIPSGAAFKALVALPLLLWWACIATGMAAHEGRPQGKFSHPLLWFDKLIFKRAGDVIPMAVMLLRLAAAALSGGIGGKGRAGPSLWPGTAKLYASLVALRLAVYGLHLLAHRHQVLDFHLVSDHMMLAGMVVTMLQVEVMCVVGDLCSMGAAAAARQQQHRQQQRAEEMLLPASGQELLLALALVAGFFLMVCTAGDVHFTARFFHHPLECFGSTVLVFALFQAPALHWLYRRRVVVAA